MPLVLKPVGAPGAFGVVIKVVTLAALTAAETPLMFFALTCNV